MHAGIIRRSVITAEDDFEASFIGLSGGCAAADDYRVLCEVFEDGLEWYIVESAAGWLVDDDFVVERRKLVPDSAISKPGWVIEFQFYKVIGHERSASRTIKILVRFCKPQFSFSQFHLNIFTVSIHVASVC